MRLNANSPVPLYRQLADRLLADIDGGAYGVESKIPSEHELAERFSIGRPTVRQATDLLVRKGRLERRRGSGTFVKKPATTIDLLSLTGTSAAFKNSELDTQLELISGAVLTPNKTFSVKRRALVDNTPVMLETLDFDAELFVGLDKQNLVNRSLSALVKEVYFLEPTAADQSFSVVHAESDAAQQLDIKVNTPLLLVHRRVHFSNYRDALHTCILCRTDRFDFSQTLYPTQIS